MQRQHKYRYWYSGKMLEVGQIEFFENGSYRVNDELVGGELLEWTGLHDKNGKEIYEGDVIDKYQNAVVCFSRGTFQPRYDGGKAEEVEDPFYSFADKAEVIGNIYENPELISKP